MTREEIQQLLSLVEKAINGPPTSRWQDRRDLILKEASEDDTVNLAEFSAWFVYDFDGKDAA